MKDSSFCLWMHRKITTAVRITQDAACLVAWLSHRWVQRDNWQQRQEKKKTWHVERVQIVSSFNGLTLMCSGGIQGLKETWGFERFAESRWLDCRARRPQPVVSVVQPSDNIFLAAAPSGRLFFFHYSWLTVVPRMSL